MSSFIPITKPERRYCDANFKQLQRGTFALPAHDGDALQLTSRELALLLTGIDLKQTRPRKRYQRAG